MVSLLSSSLAIAAQSETHQQHGRLTEKDYRFVTEASQGGMFEVQTGELARQKGGMQAVRDFGERMVTDHGKANEQLKEIATRKGAVLESSMAHKQQSQLEDLRKTTGKDFDQAYVKDMVKDHRKDVKEFQNAAKDLSDPELRAFAQNTLPVLERHLRMAEDLEAAVKRGH